MKIQAPYIANLFDYAAYKGISEEVLRNYLVEKNIDVCNQNNTVTETEYLNVYGALLEQTSDKDFGIHYGCFLNLKALGFIVQISLNASSVEQGVLVLQNYLQNTFPLVSLDAEEKNGKYVLCLSGYLSKGHKMKTQDIAYLLGYSEASAYLHATCRWKTQCH